MAKPKKLANKKRTLAKNPKSTPVEKTRSGKVQKLRINIKRLPLNNLNRTQDQNILQTSYMKLRRICNSYDNTSCNKLSAQCDFNQNDVLKNEVDRKDQSKNKSNAISNVVARSKTRKRGQPVAKQTKLPNIEAKLKDINLDRQQQSHPNLTSKTRKRGQPVEKQTKLPNIEAKLKDVNLDRQQQSRPNLTLNKRNAKLRKISTESSHNELTKNFSINLRNCGHVVSSNLSFAMPIIDDNKRKNFRKLSLTKSLETVQENTEKEKPKTSNGQGKITEVSKNDEKKSNELAAVKQIPRLSLRRRNKIPNKSIKSLTNSQMENEENSLISFQPARNSTLVNGMNYVDKENAKPFLQSKTKTASSETQSSRNLANKSDEIEDLLNSLDDEEEIHLHSPENQKRNHKIIDEHCSNKSKERRNGSLITKNISNKFFHREKNIKENVFTKRPSKNTKSVKNEKASELSNPKRSTIVRREKIYDFLSQSQTSDSDVAKQMDPSADIIKKLIDQGKVRVATNCKGKGKPKLKRVRPKVKQKARDKTNKIQTKNDRKKVKFTEDNMSDSGEEDRDFEDHFHNDEYPIDSGENIANPTGDIVAKALNDHRSKDIASEQEGTFSRLARSVLINQAGRSSLQNKSRSELARKYINSISTPKNRKMTSPHSILETDLSPITMPSTRSFTKPSPWRVNEDAHLPTVFNFSRSSGNLPSFSSDFIPSTPRKEKSKVYLNFSPSKTSIMSERSERISKENEHVENADSQRENLSDPSVISSFSSNDSNAENMPPDRNASENLNENETIFNLKQLPNPRRTLNGRCPLKAINIIEVVQLPPYKHPNKTNNAKEKLNTDQPIQVECVGEVIGDIRGDESNNADKRPKDDLFGFEEYLSQTQSYSQENIECCDDTAICRQNQTMHDKLHDLRKLKPEESELETNLSKVRSVAVFHDDDTKADGMRQRGIKEMLCSTMIHQEPSTSKEALRELNNRNLRSTKQVKFGEDTDVSELFKDPDPETTFNEHEAHRTYIRPYKRKRRLKENKYVVYLDSEESGDEDLNKDEKQKSKESNSSSELVPKKKRQNREPNIKPQELVEFVEEFNKLCKDVDSYQLIVEKSA